MPIVDGVDGVVGVEGVDGVVGVEGVDGVVGVEGVEGIRVGSSSLFMGAIVRQAGPAIDPYRGLAHNSGGLEP
jgi:hypothetical protein